MITVDYSALDYLRSDGANFLKGGELNIVTTCLNYLCLDAIGTAASETDNGIRERLTQYPFLAYAAQYWGDHVRSSKDDTSIHHKAFRFLKDTTKVACVYRLLAFVVPQHDESYVRWPHELRSGTHLAAYFGLDIVIEQFRSSGYELETQDDNNQTPLSWAIDRQHLETIRILIDGWNAGNPQFPNGTQPPLIWAVKNNNRAMVSLLSRVVDDIETSDHGNHTPLFWAAGTSEEAIVKFLIEHGANHELRDDRGRTPLSWAAANGQENNLRLLLAIPGITVDVEDHAGRTPLSLAAGNGHGAVVALLLEREDVLPDSRDESLRTPLSWAAGGGHQEVVKLLLESGQVDPNSEDADTLTPYLWAGGGDHYAVAELLEPSKQHVNGG